MKNPIQKRTLSIITAVCVISASFFTCGSVVNAKDEFPEKFDLRDKGVVTPVKLQNPWGSCWSFAGIAAAEISILSDLGITNEDYKKSNNGENFDLSEKHMAYFAQKAVTERTSPTQAGEGLYVFGADNNPNYPYNSGGYNILVSTLFSSGVGPMLEEIFPYKGAEGLTSLQFAEKYPDRVKDEVSEALRDFFNDSTDNAYKKLVNPPYDNKTQSWIDSLKNKGYFNDYPDISKISFDEFYGICHKYYISVLKNGLGNSEYSESDDWSIPELDEDGDSNRDLFSGYTIIDGNILPELATRNEQDKWLGISEKGMKAAKSELMKGHGIAINFAADDSRPSDLGREGKYMNYDTYAQYTYDDVDTTHAVCIIGWDDNYSKENFKSDHQPPENGAWIVKNSWGSETDYTDDGNGITIGKSDWGVKDESGKHTGYFYLSYYDKSVADPESFSFGNDFSDVDGFDVWAYDFMPALSSADGSMSVSSDNVVKTASIFVNYSDNIESLRSVSTKTSTDDAKVQYHIYRINKDYNNPEDGSLLSTKEATYEYRGFHREKLDGSVKIAPNEAIAVVVTESSVVDGKTKYGYDVNAAFNETAAKKAKDDRYGVAIVNEYESFIYDGSAWHDWKDYIKEQQETNTKMKDYAVDNFSIRTYMVDASRAIYRLYNPNSGEHFYTQNVNEKNYLDNIGWDYENISWQSPIEDSLPVYRVYSKATGDHHYTTNAAERDMLVSLGWQDEGISQYATTFGAPVYRVFNPNAISAGSHHYTTNAAERDMLVNLGWRDEGIGWYSL